MRFTFIAKHRGIGALSSLLCNDCRQGVGMALRSAGRVAVGLPCLAHPIAEPAQPGRRGDRREGAGELHRVGADLWRKTRLARRACGRHRLRPSPHRAADACAGLASQAPRPRRRGLPKDVGQRSTIAPNTLDREFHAKRPNQRWIADFTYVWTAEGWLYVAAVIDLFSRRVVGWSMKAEMTAQLVTDALIMAIWRRGKPDALLHHSDRGSQGGFKRSSQHPTRGCCDGQSEASISTVRPQAPWLARPPAGCRA